MTNNRFEQLEKRAKKIQLKIRLKFLLLFLILVFFIALVLIFTHKTPAKLTTLAQESTLNIKENVDKEVRLTENNVSKNVSKEDNTTKLEEKAPKKLSFSLPSEKKEQKEQEEQNITTNSENIQIPEKKENTFSLHVTQTNEQNILLRNFDIESNYKNAIAISKYYFDNLEYKKSIFWAKKSSRLQPESALPWILYAKSRNELHQKEDAIKALESYLSYFPSPEVRSLLSELKQEK